MPRENDRQEKQGSERSTANPSLNVSITSYRVGPLPFDVIHPSKDGNGSAHGILILYGGSPVPNFRYLTREIGNELALEGRYRSFCPEYRSNILGNRFEDFGMHDRIEDAAQSFEHIRTDDRYAIYPLSVVAVSMGAPIAIAAAARTKQEIRNLILIAPAAYDKHLSDPRAKFGSPFFKERILEDRNWLQSDTFAEAASISVRRHFLITFGRDEVIPAEVTEMYREALKPKEVVLSEFEHGGTFVDEKKRAVVTKCILDFFRSRS